MRTVVRITTMPQDTIDCEALFGGASRQPPHLRFKHQVEDSSNARFSVVDGFSKRPGTWFLREVTGLPSNTTDFRLHPIIRDSGERYVVIYGAEGTLRVLELGNAEATVSISDDALVYLTANDPRSDQLKLVSEVDSTFIVNTTVPVGAIPAESYVVQSVFNTYELMTATTPAAGTYHQVLNDSDGGDAGYYRYDGAPNGSIAILAKIQFARTTGAINASAAGLWDNAASDPYGFAIGFQRIAMEITGGTWTVATKNLTKTGAFTAYQRTPGDHIYVTGGTGVTAGWYEVLSRNSDDDITLASNIAGADNADTTTQGIGIYVELQYEADSPTLDDMGEVAAKVQRLLREAGAPGCNVSWTDESTVLPGGFGTAFQGYFTIVSPFGGEGATITPPAAPSTGTSIRDAGEPFDASAAVITPGSGTASGTPVWTAVPAPGTDYGQLDATKMPIQMRRTAVRGDYAPAAFDVDLIEWTERPSGDQDTNPVPRMFTDELKISEIRFFQSRFCLAAGESVVMSQTDDYFNFFVQDVDNLVDSDPVIVTLSSEQITVVESMVPFQKAMALFTRAGKQFQLGFTEILTPASATVTPSTGYTTLPLRPQAIGSRLYFLAQDGYGTQLMEYQYDEESVRTTADDVSGHVPGYLPAKVRSMVSDSNSSMTLILDEDDPNRLFVHFTFFTGEQKQQSAWGTYDFDSGYTIADICVIEGYCYMLVKKDSLWALERFSLAAEPRCVPIEAVV